MSNNLFLVVLPPLHHVCIFLHHLFFYYISFPILGHILDLGS